MYVFLDLVTFAGLLETKIFLLFGFLRALRGFFVPMVVIRKGESKMAFIVCVSAALANSDETLSSLNFASRAVTVEQARHAQRHVARRVTGDRPKE